ncbi:MAG: M23 family metallopeptidase [Flavobacteriales bacterium]|nr:M23 family metallopeptidase [Flavobacteriales bacterium]
MTKTRYKYNPETLNYERVQVTWQDYLKKVLSVVISGLFFAGFILFIAYTYFDSPKEIALERENQQLLDQYRELNVRLEQLTSVLSDMEHRDDNIYRVIFEAEPIDNNKRLSGIGGVNRYRHLEGYEFSDVTVETNRKLDELSKRMVVQSESLDEIVELAKNKEDLLRSIPAIQPVANKDLTRMASGYGMRIDPHYKVPKMHQGMDFTAPTGTPIYATGDGVVSRADNKSSGYGNHIRIDHGFGYVTLYAHLSQYKVRKGQKVKRGDIIGLVGNTGKSKGPHLHYEVRLNKDAINPINFYFNDITAEEYARLIEMAENSNQSLD